MPKIVINKRATNTRNRQAALLGEKKIGLTLAIHFCDKGTNNDDVDESAAYATIKVKIDPNGNNDGVNLDDKKSPQIKNLTYTSAEVMEVI